VTAYACCWGCLGGVGSALLAAALARTRPEQKNDRAGADIYTFAAAQATGSAAPTVTHGPWRAQAHRNAARVTRARREKVKSGAPFRPGGGGKGRGG
jgi:hypothetical protein